LLLSLLKKKSVLRVDLLTHYQRNRLLRLLWLKADVIFTLLKPTAQWELHELYQPSLDLIPEELDRHVATLHRDKPSLLNRVGKYYKQLESTYLFLIDAGFSLVRDGLGFRRAVMKLIAQRDNESYFRGYRPQRRLAQSV
jgi:hypothetical protein